MRKIRKLRMEKTIVRNPDFIEVGLIGVLVIWSISAFILLQQAANIQVGNYLLSWTSLTTFFSGIISIVLIVIAIILADIRKALAR
ncbi:hypothetical protein HOE41_01900 [Candidatus Woesearchaeota archaeon]|nr:hypothetical protein [Candidatus Woesearchaeota archaeon]